VILKDENVVMVDKGYLGVSFYLLYPVSTTLNNQRTTMPTFTYKSKNIQYSVLNVIK